jgi:hypothetical protein
MFGAANRSATISLWRRMITGGLTGVLAFAVARALIIPREQVTAAVLWIATGAAYILALYIAMEGARWGRRAVARVIAIAAASMTILALGALVIERLNQLRLGGWRFLLVDQLQRAGEVGYLVTLCGAAIFALSRPRCRRDWFANAIALAVFGTTGGVCAWALINFRGDLILVLSYALRVTWLVDQYPAVYLVIVCAAISAAIGAASTTAPAKKEVALGILLLICSGYAPRSPDRLLIYVLGVLQLSRGVIIDALWTHQPTRK